MTRQLITLDDVSFSNPALPTILPSALEKHIANLPGLRFWFDPQSKFQPNGAGEGIRDRVMRVDSVDYSNSHYTLDAALNGKPSMTVVRASNQGLGFTVSAGALSFMMNGYTIFGVSKRTEAAQTMNLFSTPPQSGVNRFRFFAPIGANNRPTVLHSDASAISSNFELVDNLVHLYMMSWNAQNGTFALEIDGVNPGVTIGSTMTAPILGTTTSFGIGTQGGVVTNSNGSFGNILLLDRPYHNPEYATVKAALVAALKSNYGIA